VLARLLFAVLGLAIGLGGPRRPRTLLTAGAGFLALVFGAIGLATTGASIRFAALGLAGLLFAAVCLTRLWPRMALLPLLAIALLTGAASLIGSGLPAERPARIGIGIGLLVLLLVLTYEARRGLRVAAALLGAMLMWGVGPLAQPRWAFALTAAALFLASRRELDDADPPPWRTLLPGTALASGGVLLLTLAIGRLAPSVATADPERLARVRQEAPLGGILWPLPSEAILWEGTLEPAVSNLDALYLGGSPAGWPALAPGTSLQGRFALNGPVQRLRVIKEPGELQRLRKSSQAAVQALLDSLPLFKVGGSEAAIAAAIREGYRRHGCSGESFPPIVAAGRNGLDPHYFANAATLQAGDVVVVDIGCYVDHYASDFTRSIPVGGSFTPRARQLYTALDQAGRVAEQACRPGAHLYGRRQREGADTTAMVVERLLQQTTGQERMPHGLGHPLGLFVHDVFDWSGPLRAGMVVMLEPGVYLPDEGIGLRLEDAYQVTATGCELLTDGFPTAPDAVEQMVRAALVR
jgi:Xaa-Pro aminopeptidase